MTSFEEAVESFGNVLRSWAPQGWRSLMWRTPIYGEYCGGMRFEYEDEHGVRGRNLSFTWEGIDVLCRNALVVRDHFLQATGRRIWGLTFTLYPEGIFNIVYEEIRPDTYTEKDEEAEFNASSQDELVVDLLGGLVTMGVKVDVANPADQPSVSLVEAHQLHTALVWLQERTAAEAKEWALGSEENWDADLNGGWLRWTFADGRVMQAEVQVVGTYNTANGTFLWGWDHPSVPEPLRRAAKLAQALGVRENFLRLTTRTIACTEDEAWQFTALAAQLDDATGAYRGNANGTWVYMAYGRPVAIRESA